MRFNAVRTARIATGLLITARGYRGATLASGHKTRKDGRRVPTVRPWKEPRHVEQSYLHHGGAAREGGRSPIRRRRSRDALRRPSGRPRLGPSYSVSSW